MFRSCFLLFRPMLLAATTILSLGCGSRDEAINSVVHSSEGAAIGSGTQVALTDIYGVDHHPFTDREAAAIVLVFTMQDCPIANSYVPTLNKLFNEYQPRGVRLLLVHIDPQLTNEAARKHAEDYQIEAPVVVDRQHSWVDRAGANKSPEVVVFSPTGQILYSGRIDDRYAGYGKRRAHVSSNDLRDAIDAILAGRPVAQPKTEAIGCFIPSLGG
jgi:hypothetical protein